MRRFVLFFVAFIIGFTSCKKDSKHHITKYHRQSVGSWGDEILSDNKYKSLTVQIIYMTGCKPTDEAVGHLKALLNAHCKKPKGIEVVYKEIAAQGKTSYTLDDIKQLEEDNRTEYTWRKNIAITYLFVDAPSSESGGSGVILGEAYYNTSLVIFEKSVQDYSDNVTEPERYKLETVVMNHELGHILGLVNLGSSMKTSHEDGSHPAHCNNQDCLMYWEAETGSAINNLLGNSPSPSLDANCIADLQGNGGK